MLNKPMNLWKHDSNLGARFNLFSAGDEMYISNAKDMNWKHAKLLHRLISYIHTYNYQL